MKPIYRWIVIYTAILFVAFFGSVFSSATNTLFAGDSALTTVHGTASTVFSNTVPLSATIAITPATSLNQQRKYHVATLLADGKVLVAGGVNTIYDPKLRRTSSEIYDPATDQWIVSGNLTSGRAHAVGILLNSGKVLVTGGAGNPATPDAIEADASAELYDPVAGSWSSAGTMHHARAQHTATLLADGRVLVVGGGTDSAEIYDPGDGSWTLTGSMQVTRTQHTATLLPNNEVLVTGGTDGTDTLSSAERYDPITGNWSDAAAMNQPRAAHKALLLQDGNVLVVGGTLAELYDPSADEWFSAGTVNAKEPQLLMAVPDDSILYLDGTGFYSIYDQVAQTWSRGENVLLDSLGYSATPISATSIVIAGGGKRIWRGEVSARVLLVDYLRANQLSAQLSLPSGWITNRNTELSFQATSTAAPLEAAALRNDNGQWGEWLPITPGDTVTTTWDFGSDNANKTVYLRLRDNDGQTKTIISGTVMVDATPPSSSMTAPVRPGNGTVPTVFFSPATFNVAWQGSDAMSGIAGYTLQVKEGMGADWTDIFISTTATQTNYVGQNEMTYFFRVRAIDVAGNVEGWPQEYDGVTQVDAEAPTGFVDIASVGTSSALLLLDADDNLSGVVFMKVGLAEEFESAEWQNYETTATISFGGPSPAQFLVYAQFRDLVGNVSAVRCISHGEAVCPDEPVGFETTLPMIRR